MSTLKNVDDETSLWRQLTTEVAKLTFITAFFGWVFTLLTRLAEPMMSLSAIYIIICSGVPSWKIDVVYMLAIAFLLSAPEIILPGAFLLSNTGTVRGKQGFLLWGMCWVFVILTFITMLQLFVWHMETGLQNLIMCLRCAASICYSILIRVIQQEPVSSSPTQLVAPSPDELVTPDLVAILAMRLQPELAASVLSVIRTEMNDSLEKFRTAVLTQRLGNSSTTPTAATELKTTATPHSVPARRFSQNNITPISRRAVTENHILEIFEKLKTQHPEKKVTAEELRVAAGISKDRACRFLRDHPDAQSAVS